jgi:ABC-type ATPase with predicted acetyltransferase domain
LNITLPIEVEWSLPATPADNAGEPSSRMLHVASMFGLSLEPGASTPLIPPTTITLRPGQVVFITGASGGGKSTLLRLIAEATADHPRIHPIAFDAFDAGHANHETPLIDAVDDGRLPMEAAMELLSLAGLNDARVMLRRPSELSDGQRHRYQLARAMAEVACLPSADDMLPLLLADEFTATLDRTTAAALARNVRKWVTRSQLCFIAATTHDDLLEPLEPDVLVEKPLGAGLKLSIRE